MIESSGTAAGPGQTSIAERANQALLTLADRADQRKSEAELSAIATACARAEALTARLEASSRVAAKFDDLGVARSQPVTPPGATKAIPNLRRTATRAADPGYDLTEPLRSGAVQDALKTAENTAKLLEQALITAADAERRQLTPAALDRPVAATPGNESLQARIRKIQSSLSQRFSGTVDDLPSTVARWRRSAVEWDGALEEVNRALAVLPPEIKAFVETAASDSGAPWSMLTAAVREWLDTDGHGDGYQVRKW